MVGGGTLGGEIRRNLRPDCPEGIKKTLKHQSRDKQDSPRQLHSKRGTAITEYYYNVSNC